MDAHLPRVVAVVSRLPCALEEARRHVDNRAELNRVQLQLTNCDGASCMAQVGPECPTAIEAKVGASHWARVLHSRVVEATGTGGRDHLQVGGACVQSDLEHGRGPTNFPVVEGHVHRVLAGPAVSHTAALERGASHM
jgi:hypothetical protein